MPDDDYPIVLTTGRVLEHWDTGAMSRRAETLSALSPEPVTALNPYKMGEMRIGTSDMRSGSKAAGTR